MSYPADVHSRRPIDTVIDWLLPVTDRLFDSDSRFVTQLETKLREARIPTEADRYLAGAVGLGLGLGLFLWVAGIAVGVLLFTTGLIEIDVLLVRSAPTQAIADVLLLLRTPVLVGATGLLFGAVGFGIGFGGPVVYPYFRANEREREINMLLPDAVAFMYALSVGGLNQLEIIKAVAKAEDTYGEVAVEFQTIRKETEYFDTDYRTAIRNQALATPSDDLSQFLTDMLSIISSGGDMESFLDDKKDTHLRTAKQQQEQTLETLELFGEMYMTLSLFPLLLIIVLVIMQMVGQAQMTLVYLTVYGLIPIIGVAFLILVSTVKQDDPGDGYLTLDRAEATETDSEPLSHVRSETALFRRLQRYERLNRLWGILRRPHVFFRDQPLYTLAVTVPVAVVVVSLAVVLGSAPTTWDGSLTGETGLVQQPVWGTFLYVYLPAYLVGVPLAGFYEWNVRSRRAITATLSDNLRKLSSANDTGLTLLESFRTVSETGGGKLATEFQILHAKVNYGMSLQAALIELNNKYHLPRLARTIKLIEKAQEASSQITRVLQTAAVASENQDELERQRQTRTRMQIVIIIMTFLTLLAVMAILQSQFLGVMDGLVGGDADLEDADQGFGVGDLDPDLLSLLFFHAVTAHAVVSGMIAGYMRDGELLAGVKYVIALLSIALGVWVFV